MERSHVTPGISALTILPLATIPLIACGNTGGTEQDEPPATGQAVEKDTNGRPFHIEVMGTMDSPWALEFLPGTSDLLITTQPGELWLHDTESGEQREVSGVPEDVLAEGQGGLADVVAAPDFEESSEVYLSWVESSDEGSAGVIGRATLEDATLEDLDVVWEQQPAAGSGHFSLRMAFSPDGEDLFVSSGDRQALEPAQDLESGLGAILRLTPDGGPAPDNPWSDQGEVADQVWSYGHRNPLGLAFDDSGHLWSSEMGPAGGDELNLIESGGNYGWPEVSQGDHYDGESIPDHSAEDDFVEPQAWWNPAISPGSLMIYQGELFEEWQGDAFLGGLSGESLVRVDLDGETAGDDEVFEMGERIRDVAEAPDGSIWLIEDDDGASVLRLTPAD